MELPGNCYAINRGKYTGKFIVFVRKNGRYNEFLVIPGSFKILILDKKDLEKAKAVEIANKLNKFERVKHGGSVTIDQSIELTKQNFIKNLRELNDIAIVKDTILPEHFNLLDSFEKKKCLQPDSN